MYPTRPHAIKIVCACTAVMPSIPYNVHDFLPALVALQYNLLAVKEGEGGGGIASCRYHMPCILTKMHGMGYACTLLQLSAHIYCVSW